MTPSQQYYCLGVIAMMIWLDILTNVTQLIDCDGRSMFEK